MPLDVHVVQTPGNQPVKPVRGFPLPLAFALKHIGVQQVLSVELPKLIEIADELGLAWPRAIAPADVHVVAAHSKDEAVFAAAEQVAADLQAAGLGVLLDDRRKVSPGVKFKDAELIGVPTILVVGKGLADGVIEVKDRVTGERADVAVGEVVQYVVAAVRG